MSRALRLLVAASVLTLAVGDARAYEIVICVDPGHGDWDPGAGPYWEDVACNEKTMNLNVGLCLRAVLGARDNYDLSFLTRDDDTFVVLRDRIDAANAGSADAFVSVHQNTCGSTDPPQIQPCSYCSGNYSEVLHCSDQPDPWNDQSGLFAEIMANEIYAYYSYWYGSSNNGAVDTCNAIVIEGDSNHPQHRPAILGEAAFICSSAGDDLCEPWASGPYDQAYAYYRGICSFFSTCTYAIGTEIGAAGGPGVVNLTWHDSDASSSIFYDVLRSDTCWGQFSHVAYIDGDDPTYTSDGENFLFPDTSVEFSRDYFYRIFVSTGELTGIVNGVPSGLPSAMPPTTPLDTQATGSYLGGAIGTVDLSWTASSGTVEGYYVRHSTSLSMTTCASAHETLATLPGTITSYAHTNAVTGPHHFYHVQAFNSTGCSSVSAEMSCQILPPVDVAESDPSPDRLQLHTSFGTSGGALIEGIFPTGGSASLKVFDIQGRLVDEVYNGRVSRGVKRWQWGGNDGARAVHASGVYFARLQLGSERVQARFVLVR